MLDWLTTQDQFHFLTYYNSLTFTFLVFIFNYIHQIINLHYTIYINLHYTIYLHNLLFHFIQFMHSYLINLSQPISISNSC